MRRRRQKSQEIQFNEGEFLWLVSLSDLMILLFVFFVVLFSYTYRKLNSGDLQNISKIFSAKGDVQATPLDDIQRHLVKWTVDHKLLDSVDVSRKEDGLILQLKEKILFEPGQAALKPESTDMLQEIKLALEQIPPPYRIGIEGHTDDTPMKGDKSNWELSLTRATNVLKYLNLKDDALKRTVLMGYGEMQPLVPNRDEHDLPIADNQQKNRRVTIRIF